MTRPTGASDGAPRADEPAVSRHRLLRAVLVVVPLGGLAYALLAAAPGFDETAAAIRQIRGPFVLLALAAEAVHVLAMAQAYRSALAALDVRMPYRRQLLGFVAGYGVGQLLPAGGAVGGAVVGQRMIAAGAPRAAAAAAVVLTGTISLLSVALLVSAGLLVTTLSGGSTPAVLGIVLAAAVGLVAAVALVLAVIRSPSRGNRLLDRMAGVMRRVGADVAAWRDSVGELATAPPRPGGLTRVVLWTMLAWVGNATVLWAAFAGLGEVLAGDVLLLGFGLQHVVAMIPVSPGGLGLVEAGVAGTLTGLGVPSGTAVTGVIGYRLVAFWLPVVVGVVVYLRSAGWAGADGPVSEVGRSA